MANNCVLDMFGTYLMTVGFLYAAGAETLILVTRTVGNICSQAKKKNSGVKPRKPRKTEAWISGAEIQTSAMDTRTAVWVSTAEEIIRGKLGNALESLGGISAPALYKNQAVI